jgi:hypothetical protein
MEKLISGLIPKNQICPFVEKCRLECLARKAENNLEGFSCGLARAFDISSENPKGRFAEMVATIHNDFAKDENVK